jgi:arylsulfatase A
MLRDAGYRTGIVGKWHLGMSAGCDPIAQGFQHGYFTPAFNGASRDIKPGAVVPFMRSPGEIVRTITTQADMDTLTADCTREALEFMRASKDKPFFLYLAYHMPHVPLGVSENFAANQSAACMATPSKNSTPPSVRSSAELKKLALDDNTLVVFTSDNGPGPTNKSATTAAVPLPFRGAKMTTWEGGWRVPGIVRWPGKVRAGRNQRRHRRHHRPDAHLRRPVRRETPRAPNSTASTSRISSPSQRTQPTRHLSLPQRRTPHRRAAQGLETRLRPTRSAARCPTCPAWLTGHIESLPETQLFNLRTDSAESRNLAAESPAIVTQLTDLAAQSRATLGDYTGPGKENRFFDAGPRWPKARPAQKIPPPKPKPTLNHECQTPALHHAADRGTASPFDVC